MGGYSETEDTQSAKVCLNFQLGWVGGGYSEFQNRGILYGFNICVTSSIFKYYALFHECLGYYIYLLLFPIIFTLLLIFH